MPFQPGQSGNPTGIQKSKPFYEALNRAIAQDDAKKLRAAAEALLKQAAEGEQWAVKELADRLDGKSPQAISIDANVTQRKAADLTDDQLAAHLLPHATGNADDPT